MPHLIGLQVHSDNLTIAALRPDQAIVLRPVDDMASVIQRTCARRWKWSLGVEGREADAMAAAHELGSALQEAMGGEQILAGIAVPAVWNDRARRAFLRSLDGTQVEALRLVRDTTALAIGASLVDPTIAGLCVVVHVGTHKLELAVTEIGSGTIKVRSRQSVVGLDGSNMRPETLLPLIAEVGNFAARQAGVSADDIQRLIANGRRLTENSLADDLGGVWGVGTEVYPPGTIALGAAHVAVGLTGMLAPWTIVDDLDEPPLATLRGTPARRALTPAPEPPPPPASPPRFIEEIEIPLMFDEPAESPPVAAPPTRDTLVPRPPPPTPSSPPRAPSREALPMISGSPTPVTREAVSFDTGRSNEYPSVAPTGAPVAEPPRSGQFTALASLLDIRALHVLHPTESDGFVRPSIVSLFNQFAFLRSLSGTLRLHHKSEEIVIPIERGGVCLTTAERGRALRPFEWSEGTYTWTREKLPWQVQKHRSGMTAFVVAGIRLRLRGIDDAVFAQSHQPKLRLAPSVIDDRRNRLARLALPEAEDRAVDHVLDGSRSFEKMLSEGYIGRTTLHRLVVLLDLYGVLQWSEPAAAAVENPIDVMTRLINQIQLANHFVALGVHWSVSTDEIRQAWDKMQSLYGPESANARHDPRLAARIIQRGATAWAVLSVDARRVQHRRDAYPGMDEDLLAPLVEGRAKALSMRGEKSEAARMMALRGEFKVNEDNVAAPATAPAAAPKPKA